MAQVRDIKYVNKDFNDFRNQLIDYAKTYFPNNYNDFDPTSPGMMFMEMAAYVGDILSFYQDTQLQETFAQHAKDPKNLYSLAYMMGYRPKTTHVSEAEILITQTVGVDESYDPDWSQATVISSNGILTSTDASNTKFFIENSVDFNYSSSFDPTEVIISALDGSNNPSEYLLRKRTKAISAEIITTTLSIDTTQKFRTFTIQDSNIVGILDVVDQDDNNWYEVPFLGQDTIYKSEDVNATQPHTLVLEKAPRRFVSRHLSSGYLQLQFGAGTNDSDDSEILPDPLNVGFGSNDGISRLDYAYDPSNFLHSKSYGIAPTAGTTLTIRYLKGGGVTANVPANTITSQTSINATNTPTLSFTNPEPARGGRGADTVEELRENAMRAFNEQGRMVTLQDYTVRASSLPSKYGGIAKVYATQDQLTNSNINPSILSANSPLDVTLYLLAYDNTGRLTTASTLVKNNLKTYLSEYKIVSDSITFKDAFIVNIGVNYEVILRPNAVGRDVLLQCNTVLQSELATKKRSINQPINISDLYTKLDRVKGVQTVQNIEIVNKAGGDYSEYGYDIKGATRNNVVYPSYDPCIFELKFPNVDIKGRITTL